MNGLFIGRRALVTGSGSGIGRAIALRLAQEGADVYVLDLNAALAEAVAQEVRALGRRAMTLVHDTSDAAVIAQLVAAQAEGFGPIDLVVNNAGISPKTAEGRKRMVWETCPNEWQQVIGVNLNGYFHVLRAVLPAMIERRRGAVVNIGSLAGQRYSTIAGAAYATAKSAVSGLTRQVAGEVAPHAIRVNCIAPGRIETEMAARAGSAFNEEIRTQTPLGRLGMPEDIAETAVFLLSDAASFITGQTITASGGRGL